MAITKWLFGGTRPARAVIGIVLAAAMAQYSHGADNVETFNAYVDSSLCAKLMVGPISEARLACTRDTHKQGSEPVLVRLSDNLVFGVNKTKLIDPFISQTVSATGTTKPKDGRMKLDSVSPLPPGTVKPGSPGYELLDVRHFRLTGDGAKISESIRHELAMMPYISNFDFISYSLAGNRVILTGWTVRTSNRTTAYNLVKNIKGVEQVTNNIEVLPLGPLDMQTRAAVRAVLQRFLSRYFWGAGSAIKIIVKNGDVILLGVVANQSDIDTATIQANSVPNVFKVFNLLRVESKGSKAGK